MGNYDTWNKKQGEDYIKSLKTINDLIPKQKSKYVVYKITVSTVIGVFTYIGQTENLIRRVYQHKLYFDIINIRILHKCKTREQALKDESVAITLASSPKLLNMQYNLQYDKSLRNFLNDIHYHLKSIDR